MAELTIADVSEFQGKVDWKAYVSGGFLAAIIRAHNGNRADYQFSANRAGAHAAAVRALGMYQYLVAGRDAAVQANELCDLVGALRPGEWLICDLEEGSGDQAARGRAWLSTVVGRLHDAGSAEELYSGSYFLAAHNLSGAGFRRIWVASYGTSEPGVPHELWQFTDAHLFPGISGACDASIFHGSVADLLTHINPLTPPEDDMPYSPAQLTEFARLGALAAIESQPGRDAVAGADLWWWDHVLNGTTTPGMSPVQKALILEMHGTVVKLAQTPPVVPVAGK